VRTIDAHANLSLLTDDLQLSRALVDNDLETVTAVADLPRSELVNRLADQFGEFKAAETFEIAKAQSNHLNNFVTDLRAAAANGFSSDMVTTIGLADETPCRCDECQTAISPQSYLSELLDYTVRYIKNRGNDINLSFLNQRFAQPFNQLPATCSEEMVCQGRLAIEVLRRFLTTDQQSSAEIQPYLVQAYTSILSGVGTSYEELRLARTAEDSERVALAGRLGLPLSDGRPDQLDALLLEPDAINEQELERLFGLIDTSRDALSTEVKLGDDPDTPQITRWLLDGVDWFHNTDAEGQLYLSLTRPGNGNERVVEIFRDAARTEMVARGDCSTNIGQIDLLPQNLSGLSGQVHINYQSDNENIVLAAAPLALSLRLQDLRNRWWSQDWPEDEPQDAYPLIDPDLIGPQDFRRTSPNDPAFELWLERRQIITDEKSAIQAAREAVQDELTGLDTILNNAGIPASVLIGIADDRSDGENIAERLSDLRLDNAAFDYLLRIHRLVQENTTSGDIILDREWEDVYDILVQRFKRNNFSNWRTAERDAAIFLSSDHFRMPEVLFSITSPQPDPPPVWRASESARRTWQRRLETRMEQEQTLLSNWQEMINEVEAETLPILRTALINASDSSADELGEQLLIDFHAECCQETTRTALAIEALQQLLWSARTGQLDDQDLQLEADNFDEAWQWLGSYATWRAAMLVFLYPENLLDPSLRRWQTPAFKQLVKSTRNNTRLTPEQACQAAQDYEDYFRDVSNLELEASVLARTEIYGDECRSKSFQGDTHLVYLFARGGHTNTVYASSYDPLDETGYAQSFWEPVPGLENVLNILGAAAYARPFGRRAIHLFARIREESQEKLVSTTFDLQGDGWSGEVNEFDLPNGAEHFSSVVKQRNRENETPHLAIRLSNGAIYDRHISQDGTGWAEGDWLSPAVPPARGRRFNQLCAMIEPAQDEFYLIVKSENGRFRYRLFGEFDDGGWRSVGLRNANLGFGHRWVGGFPWPGSERIYGFYQEDARGLRTRYFSILRSTTFRVSRPQTFQSFNSWLQQRAGVSLAGLFAEDEDRREINLLDFFTRVDFDSDNRAASHQSVGFELIGTIDGKITSDSDPSWHDWKLADEMVRQFTFNGNSLADILEQLFRKKIFKIRFDSDFQLNFAFKRRPTDQERPFNRLWPSSLERIVMGVGVAPLGIEERITYKLSSHSEPLQVMAFSFDVDIDMDAWGIGGNKNRPNLLRAEFSQQDNSPVLVESTPTPVAPTIFEEIPITEYIETVNLQATRKKAIKKAFTINATAPSSVKTYLEEAWYFVPVHLALQLQRRAQFISALDWLRTVYDYTASGNARKIYYGLVQEQNIGNVFDQADNWLLDPLNPHLIAKTRRNAYTRFTLLSLIHCLLEYADSEYSRDTVETVAQARTLYTTVLELLSSTELNQTPGSCELEIDVGEDIFTLPEWPSVFEDFNDKFARLTNPRQRSTTRNDLQGLLSDSATAAREKLAQAKLLLEREIARATLPATIEIVRDRQSVTRKRIETALAANPDVAHAMQQVGKVASHDYRIAVAQIENTSPTDIAERPLPWLRGSLTTSLIGNNGNLVAHAPNEIIERPGTRSGEHGLTSPNEAEYQKRKFGIYVPAPSFGFCVPLNPVLSTLGMQAELNLYKIRTCRNIAGDERSLEPYAAPTDSTSNLPAISGGQLILPGTVVLRPTPYRYSVLIDRARHLVNLAQQIEAAFLSALEKRDAEFYQLLKAQQEVELTRAGIRLQDLRIKEAEDGVVLTELQRERAQIQKDYFQDLLDAPISGLEYASLVLLQSAAYLSFVAGTTYLVAAGSFSAQSIFSFGAENAEAAAQGFSSLASAASTQASILSTLASYERREQEWRFQHTLADQDVRIGGQQVRLAQDRVRIVGQERTIARMQADHAKETADFLANKFTNVELYDWMSGVLEGIYSFFLQQATATAQLAANQIAFERQETPPPFIQSDYWEAPLGIEVGGLPGSNTPDRRGLTGSARLLQDIYQLDQYAFETDQRKQQLTKVISLAHLSPAEFQRFRETGMLPFATSMELFERDFPGHYLRLIKRVRLSVIALIPPLDGIKATLFNTGLSRVDIASNGIFERVSVIRPPETIALTSPRDATGLFELTPTSQEMLLPFEHFGVDTSWEFQMPKAANQFDYNTIADVLVTIEYTALENFDYHRHVIQKLNRSFSAERPFSFRQEFADEWYDLNHPQLIETPNLPMVVEFETRRGDFPPNLEQLEIEHVVLFFARQDGPLVEVTADLTFVPEGGNSVGGSATSIEGIISTRRGNANAWSNMINQSPVGTWRLNLTASLSDGRPVEEAIKAEEIEDILFVITYEGLTPAWPE
jgi:hypothetical protein